MNPGQRVRFTYEKHNGEKVTGEGTYVRQQHAAEDPDDISWDVVDDKGREYGLVPAFGDTIEPI